MRRTLLFLACVLASLTMTAQENPKDYVPFVETGKQWQVVRTTMGESSHFDQYMMNKEVVLSGKTYMKMSHTEDGKAEEHDAGLLREEDRKVYFFDADMKKEFLLFDYSLKAGDTYETYSYEEQKTVTYQVMSVDNCTACPGVISYNYNETTDSMDIRQRYLLKWTVRRTDNEGFQKTWIEGVGSLEGPLENLYDVSPVSSRTYLAYVSYNDMRFEYYPFTFHDSWNNLHGSDLPKNAVGRPEDWHSQLTYELEGNRLHVYGKLVLNCTCNNYVYWFEEPTDDPMVHKLRFEIRNVGPEATCVNLFSTNFYVPGFDPNINYIIVDNQGEEHPVVNKTPQMAYRPFVEAGKVWKVGDFNSGNPVKLVEYYYFDGDTVIGGKTCKQMMCQRHVSPNYPDYEAISPSSSQSYVGAWYEDNQKVYAYDSTNNQFTLMYDFSANAYDTLQINSQRYIIEPRQTGGLKGFKGVYRDVTNHMAWKTTWLEGVGGLYGPTINIFPGRLSPAWFLMSCTVGDAVIYLNDVYEDGATPDAARKKRIDFTHTIKIKPKTRMMRTPEQPLYGEYNDQQLGINLNLLDDAYLVRITGETGKTIYEKSIDAGNIMGLSIDISAYTKGRYTVTIENSQESFTGEFDAQTTSILEVRSKRSEVRDGIYNLQGQRISSLKRGLNIVNGLKVHVK